MVAEDRSVGNELALAAEGASLGSGAAPGEAGSNASDVFCAKLAVLAAGAVTATPDAVARMMDGGLAAGLAQMASLQRHFSSGGLSRVRNID